jgi:hypothetical protein
MLIDNRERPIIGGVAMAVSCAGLKNQICRFDTDLSHHN